jgi:hypothetical protein
MGEVTATMAEVSVAPANTLNRNIVMLVLVFWRYHVASDVCLIIAKQPCPPLLATAFTPNVHILLFLPNRESQ